MTGFSPWLAAHLHTLSLWIGALCTLGLYSILYKENKLYRFFEHVFLGLATGYLVANTWTDVLLPKWWVPMWDKGMWWFAFAGVAGLLYFFVFSKKYNWMARLIIGFFLGVTSGQAFQQFVNDTWPQVPSSFKPILPHGAIPAAAGHPAIPEVPWSQAINGLIFILILVCVMSYFFFSFEQKHPVLRNSAQLGRWLMMFAFGAIFGSTMMARLALLIDRMYYLTFDFGQNLPPPIGGPARGPYFMFVVILLLVALVVRLATRSGPPEEEAGGEPPV